VVVDVHGHVTHPELLERFPMPAILGDVDGMIELKAAAGIDLTIVGSPVGFGTMVPLAGHDNYDQPLDRLKSFHDWLGETVAAHPHHLRAYAYANPFGDDELLAHVAETVRGSGFVGVMANTSVRGEYLHVERARPFFAMAEELGVPVFLHPPAVPVGAEAVGDLRLITHVARFNDVTASLALLAFHGVLDRHAGLDLIAPMAGGALALLAQRLDLAVRERAPGADEPSADGQPSRALARVYVDTATTSEAALAADLALMGPERLLFGTDSPPTTVPVEDALALVRRLDVAEEERRAILGGNARRLFGL
jgi:aminocarboxymuconate-semialdehyde decarboxylase